MPQITTSLKEKAILVDFDGGFYNWNRRDRRVESEVASTHAVSSAAGRYLKNLFLSCDTPFQKIRQAVQSARKDHDLLTLPWTPGRNLLLNKNVIRYKTLQASHFNHLDEAKSALRDSYQALLYTAERNLGPLFNESDYPSISSILDACYITHKFYPIADDTDVRLSCDAELVDSIRAEVRANAEATFNSAVLSTWERLLSILKSATTNLSKNLSGATSERFRDEWHTHLAELLPILSGLNLSEDPRLDEMARRCHSLIVPDPDEYKVNLDARAAAYTKAQSIYDDLSSIYGSLTTEPRS